MQYDKKGKQVYFAMSDLSTLSNICQAAAARFAQDAEEFRKLVDYTPPEGEFPFFPWGEAAKRLVEQFEQQSKEARLYSQVFQMGYDTGHDFGIPMEPADYEEAVG